MPDFEMSLIVSWVVGKNVFSGPIDVSGEVVDIFEQYVKESLESVETLQHIPTFDPDCEYESSERHVLRASTHDFIDIPLLDVLRVGHLNENVTSTEMNTRRPRLYAISALINGTRNIFVRATSPVKFPSKSLRGYLTDSFNLLKDPILSFDEKFDFLIRDEEIIIFNPNSFERITNSPENAEIASKRLVASLSEVLPINEDSKMVLTSFLGKNTYSRRKALSVCNKGYLESLDIARISDKLEKHGLKPDNFLDGSDLVFTSENCKQYLELLNDDVFQGDFSGEDYAAARKASF
ncbi:Kiwa anti-phage protein KwaB-like domain-containing protein [Glutamicibacter sp. AGC46]